MNWEIEHIEDYNYVKVTAEGVFSIEEHPECFNKLLTSEFWKPGINILFDNRNFDFGQIGLDQLKTASNQYQSVSQQLGDGKAALLMKSQLNFGIGRQFTTVSEGKGQREIRVFNDEKKAHDWLLEDTKAFQIINN